MKYKKSLKYSILGTTRSVIVFYIIIGVVIFLSLIGMVTVTDGSSRSSINGMELSTAIFIFVLGLNSFKDKLFMLIQNGVSRKTFFLSSITSFVILCFFMSAIDLVISMLAKFTVNFSEQVSYSSFFESLYSQKIVGMSAVALNLESFLWNLCLYLAMATAGFFITISYYRMNKSMKVLVSVGVPVGLFVVLPVVDQIVNGKITLVTIRALDFAIGISLQNPFHAMGTFLLAFVVFSGLSWQLVRKVMVHSN